MDMDCNSTEDRIARILRGTAASEDEEIRFEGIEVFLSTRAEFEEVAR